MSGVFGENYGPMTAQGMQGMGSQRDALQSYGAANANQRVHKSGVQDQVNGLLSDIERLNSVADAFESILDPFLRPEPPETAGKDRGSPIAEPASQVVCQLMGHRHLLEITTRRLQRVIERLML